MARDGGLLPSSVVISVINLTWDHVASDFYWVEPGREFKNRGDNSTQFDTTASGNLKAMY